MVGSGLTVMVPKAIAGWATRGVTKVDTIPSQFKGADINGAINFLLLGSDDGDDPSAPDRSDSMVLVHIPAAHSAVYMISLPRDLLVDIVNPDTGQVVSTSKLNSAFADAQAAGGKDTSAAGRARAVSWVMATVSNIVSAGGDGPGLTFNGWATIDFNGFDQVVAALGTVYLCFDEDAYSVHYWANGTPADGSLYNYATSTGDYTRGYHYPLKQCRDLQPWEALDYSRIRYGLPNVDYDRQRHQQQLLKAIVDKALSPDTFTNLNTLRKLQQAAGNLLTLDLGGKPPEDWIFTLRNLRSDDIVMIKTNGGKVASVMEGDDYLGEQLTPDMVTLLKAVQNDSVAEFLSVHMDWIAPAAA